MFDGYHLWLSIPKDQRPPTYYQLLGIAPDEQDPEVIRNAAARAYGHVRNYQGGPHAKEASQILEELADARRTLLDPAKRAQYDAKLTQATVPAGSADQGDRATLDDTPAVWIKVPQIGLSDQRPDARRSSRLPNQFTLIGIGIGGFLFCLILLVSWLLSGTGRSSLAQRDPEPKKTGEARNSTTLAGPVTPPKAPPPQTSGEPAPEPKKTEQATNSTVMAGPVTPPEDPLPLNFAEPVPEAEQTEKAKNSTNLAVRVTRPDADDKLPPPGAQAKPAPVVRLDRKRPDAEQAIHDGVRFLKQRQRADGSWPDADSESHTGTTSLVTLALLSAGEPASAPQIVHALEFLRNFGPEQLKSTYAVALQTMVFAAAEPDRDQLKIAANVRWLQDAQIKPGDRVNWPGSWTYSAFKTRNGDNSNTQHALVALKAASEAGVKVKPEVWALARGYWAQYQHQDGGWGYTPASAMPASASMTCAGISSLIITRSSSSISTRAPNPIVNKPKKVKGKKVQAPKDQAPKIQGGEVQTWESLDRDQIRDCGKRSPDVNVQGGLDWIASRFRVSENTPIGQQWRYYYLCGLERVGRLTGLRFFGSHDWYREGADKLVHDQDKLQGFWQGAGPTEGQEPVGLITTSFALIFLGRGGAPVLIQKAKHGPGDDWSNDPHDVRNLVAIVARDRKQSLNWQIVDLDVATDDDLLLAPILFLNGHQAPQLGDNGKKALRSYVERGGFVFAEACCGRSEFDQGFRSLLNEVFPEPESPLYNLAEDHPVWRAKHRLNPNTHPLWGLEREGRTVLIYSPQDLSCFWHQAERSMDNPAVTKAVNVGQNVVAHAVFTQ
jgi:hypothetical protein